MSKLGLQDRSLAKINAVTKTKPKDLISLDTWLTPGNNSMEAKILRAWELAGATVWEGLPPTEQAAAKRKKGASGSSKTSALAAKKVKTGAGATRPLADYFSKPKAKPST